MNNNISADSLQNSKQMLCFGKLKSLHFLSQLWKENWLYMGVT